MLRLALTPLVDGGVPFITFFPALLIASVWGGVRAGISVLVLASVTADYMWLPASWSLARTTSSWAILADFWLVGGALVAVAGLIKALVGALTESEALATILAHEMRHRVSNMLTVVQAISHQTARTAGTVAEYRTILASRLVALGRAQELVAENPDVPPDLQTLLNRLLEPFDAERFRLSGPRTAVRRDLGSSLALLIHELSTNAVKHGALSVPEGLVSISWAAEDNRTRIDWREENGPIVAQPSRTGFGSLLLRTAFPPVTGNVAIRFEPGGVLCTIRFSAEAA